jgi:hypothetical protein
MPVVGYLSARSAESDVPVLTAFCWAGYQRIATDLKTSDLRLMAHRLAKKIAFIYEFIMRQRESTDRSFTLRSEIFLN